MNDKILNSEFFDRPAEAVAEDLLGSYLVRRIDGVEQRLQIWELELYDGFEDLASHARFGLTARNAPMFGPPGVWYVYLIYGVHHMINVSVREEGYPSAILIRAAGDYDGPGKLAKALGVDRSFSGLAVDPQNDFWIERGEQGTKLIERTPRVGIPYAGDWKDVHWRYLLRF